METEQYCPICSRTITADNINEVESGEHDGYIFIHDDVPHSDSDVEALSTSIN